MRKGMKIAGLVMALMMGVSAAVAEVSGEITVVSREEGSGTRGAFIELTGVEEKNADGVKVDNTTEEAVVTNSTNVMMTTVAGDESAIGYISLGSLNDTVKALQIDGVDATVENIKNGTYTLARPFNIAIKEGLSEVAQDFVNYILSAEGQQVIADNKYIPLDDAPAYEGKQVSGKIVVAGSSSVTPVMQKLAEVYQAVNPNAEIEVQQSDSTTGMQSAIDGICDIGLVGTTTSDTSCEFLPFASDELVIAAPATPHYQAYQSIPSPLDALLKEPFLLREDNSGTKQETLYFLKNKGLSLDDLNVIAVMDDAAALKQCIMLGMGISILSKATVQADARQGKLLLFPLGEAAFLRKLYLVYSPVKYMAEEGGVFLEFAKRFYQL